ncbi:MAG TPA: DinB family protein [Acidimicrobiales bacterium]|nr:DinB family protein [Acidimicrobiales bacterium]
MDVSSLLVELYDRIPPLASGAVEGLGVDLLTAQPSPGHNPIGWLLWHTGRIQDHHVSAATGQDQLWATGDWAPRFGLDADPSNTGYGHSADEVAGVRPESAQALLDYLDAVAARTRTTLERLSPEDLDRIVDERWDPPVTLGVRLVSVADDGLQHLGQAAYVRGLLLPS